MFYFGDPSPNLVTENWDFLYLLYRILEDNSTSVLKVYHRIDENLQLTYILGFSFRM